jgi:hypothetical protein
MQILITTLDFEKNANFFAENCRKSKKKCDHNVGCDFSAAKNYCPTKNLRKVLSNKVYLLYLVNTLAEAVFSM